MQTLNIGILIFIAVLLIILIIKINTYGGLYKSNSLFKKLNEDLRYENIELLKINESLIHNDDELLRLRHENIELLKINENLYYENIKRFNVKMKYQSISMNFINLKNEFNKKIRLINNLKLEILLFESFFEINNKYKIYINNKESRTRKIIGEYMRDLFNDIEGGISNYYDDDDVKIRTTLLIPFKENGSLEKEYLQVYAYFEIGNDSIYDVKFYIGEDLNRRNEESGVAGIAYIEKRVAYAKFNINAVLPEKENPDAQYHILLPIEQEKKGILKYSMIYAKYIQINSDFGGVICIDSMKKDLFDNQKLVRYFDEFVFYNIEQFLGRYADDIMKGWQQ